MSTFTSADIGAANSLTIPPDLPVTYNSPDLLIEMQSSTSNLNTYIETAN